MVNASWLCRQGLDACGATSEQLAYAAHTRKTTRMRARNVGAGG